MTDAADAPKRIDLIVDEETLRLSAELNAQKLSPIPRRPGEAGLSFLSSLMSPLSTTGPIPLPEPLPRLPLQEALPLLTPTNQSSRRRSSFSPKTPLFEGMEFRSSLTVCRVVFAVLRWLRTTATLQQVLTLLSRLLDSDTFLLLDDLESLLNQRLVVMLDRDAKSRVFAAWRRRAWLRVSAENHFFRRLLRQALLRMDERLLFRKLLRKDRKLDAYHLSVLSKRFFKTLVARTLASSHSRRTLTQYSQARSARAMAGGMSRLRHFAQPGAKLKRIVTGGLLYRDSMLRSLRSPCLRPLHVVKLLARSRNSQRQAMRMGAVAGARLVSRRTFVRWTRWLRRVRREQLCGLGLFERAQWKRAFTRWRKWTISRCQRVLTGVVVRGVKRQNSRDSLSVVKGAVRKSALRRSICKLLLWCHRPRRPVMKIIQFNGFRSENFGRGGSTSFSVVRYLFWRWLRHVRFRARLQGVICHFFSTQKVTAVKRALGTIKQRVVTKFHATERTQVALGLLCFKLRRKALLCVLFWRVLCVRLRKEAYNLFKIREDFSRNYLLAWKVALVHQRNQIRFKRKWLYSWRNQLRASKVKRLLLYLERKKILSAFHQLNFAMRSFRILFDLIRQRSRRLLLQIVMLEWRQLCHVVRRYRFSILSRFILRLKVASRNSRRISLFRLKRAMHMLVLRIFEKSRMKNRQIIAQKAVYHSTGLRSALRRMLLLSYSKKSTRHMSTSLGPLSSTNFDYTFESYPDENAAIVPLECSLLASVQRKAKIRSEAEFSRAELYSLRRKQAKIRQCLHFLRSRCMSLHRLSDLVQKYRIRRGLSRWLEYRWRLNKFRGLICRVMAQLMRKGFKVMMARVSAAVEISRSVDQFQFYLLRRGMKLLKSFKLHTIEIKDSRRLVDFLKLRLYFGRFKHNLRSRRKASHFLNSLLKNFAIKKLKALVHSRKSWRTAAAANKVALLRQESRRHLLRWFRISRRKRILLLRENFAEKFYRHRCLALALGDIRAWI